MAAVGCGGGENDDGLDAGALARFEAAFRGGGENPPFKTRVIITDEGYHPKHVRILVGGSVTFVNLDRVPHTAETGSIREGLTDSNEFDTHTLAWEEPYTVVFHKPEKVEYHSSLDPDMKGTVEAVTKR